MVNLIVLFPSWTKTQFLSCLVLLSFWGAGLWLLVIVWSCLKLSTENICLKQIHYPVCILFPLFINWFYECLWDLSLSNWFWINLGFVYLLYFTNYRLHSLSIISPDFMSVYGIWVLSNWFWLTLGMFWFLNYTDYRLEQTDLLRRLLVVRMDPP